MEIVQDQNKMKEILNTFNITEVSEFRDAFLSYHPFDLAGAFLELDVEQRNKVFISLSPKELAPILVHIDIETLIDILEDMNSIYVAQMLEEMDVDDSVDILSQIEDRDIIISYLSIMNKEHAAIIRQLLQYDEKTAGSIMTTNFIKIPQDYEVKKAMKKLIEEANEAETIYTLYITDDKKVLVGTLSLRELILAKAGVIIKEVMNEKVISVEAKASHEEVAEIMRNYDFNTLPVVDFQGHMIGIITIDDIIDIIDEKASQTFSNLAGVEIDNNIESNALQNALSRLPWLILLLIFGMLNSNLLNLFKDTLTQIVSLSFFLPLIAGMAGNTGTQSLAITIRKLSLLESTKKGIISHVFKEAVTGLIIGIVTSIVAFILIWIIYDIVLAILVSIAIAVSLTVATTAGALVPLIIVKFKIDPAVASGPFISTLNDLISMSIYLGLATVFINHFLY
ncbi:MAG: mgtE [Haloplasmataceae bacterium]|nr:mgtE [Haloplasmataceae bacterium]